MGFLKRFFSLGSKKSKRKQKSRPTEQVDANGRILQSGQQVDGETARLLRSKSAHFAEDSDIDYLHLPPLPHPSNLLTTPASSPAPSANSMQRKGTYTVKVLERKVESCTEFPNANSRVPEGSNPLTDSPPRHRTNPQGVPVTPRDQSRLTRLRQDPSVASLLNMYDDNGRISSTAFSNTPHPATRILDVGGREQIKRSGSTLRQLLGDTPDTDKDEGGEGDISWAERVLGEHNGSSDSLASSNALETPKDILFTDSRFTKPVASNRKFTSDLSEELSGNYPAISSLEVELSNATATGFGSVTHEESALQESEEQRTPKRAAEIFGFLTERRKSILERQRTQADRTPPVPPLAQNYSETRISNTPDIPPLVPSKANRSPDTSDTSIITSPAEIQTAKVTKLTPITNPLSQSSDTKNILYSQHTGLPESSSSARIHHTEDSDHAAMSHPASKIPRGPRPHPHPNPTSKVRVSTDDQPPLAAPGCLAIRKPTRDSEAPSKPGSRTRVPKHVSGADTPVRPRQQRRVTSHTSSVVSNGDDTAARTSVHRKSRKADRAHRDKENSPPASMPLRTIFDVRHPNLVNGDPPSPASSSDLSPYTKEMMMKLRKQRMRTREEMRNGSRSSRNSRRLS